MISNHETSFNNTYLIIIFIAINICVIIRSSSSLDSDTADDEQDDLEEFTEPKEQRSSQEQQQQQHESNKTSFTSEESSQNQESMPRARSNSFFNELLQHCNEQHDESGSALSPLEDDDSTAEMTEQATTIEVKSSRKEASGENSDACMSQAAASVATASAAAAANDSFEELLANHLNSEKSEKTNSGMIALLLFNFPVEIVIFILKFNQKGIIKNRHSH